METAGQLEPVSFGKALDKLKQSSLNNLFMTRPSWYGSHAKPKVFLQRPDEDSKMSEPYLYMEKFSINGEVVRFPLDLSCESILADDWVVDIVPVR